MSLNSLYDIYKGYTELQSRIDLKSFDCSAELWNKHLKVSSELLKLADFQQTLIPDIPWQAMTPFPIGISPSSEYATPDSEDSVDEDCSSAIALEIDANVSSGESLFQRASKDSTSSIDINRINEEFRSSLLERTQTFVWALKHTDFEDGVENDITKEVQGYIEKNKYVTYLWLSSIYSNNQKDADVLAGLLRVIGMTVELEDTDMLLPMVKAGLSDPQSKTQEAALMVIEQWRTPNCLDAIETAPLFASSWIRSYAEQIKTELKEETQSC